MHYLTKQPYYSKSVAKYMAREVYIDPLYRLLTGNHNLPDLRQYWFLCNKQDDTEGSEIFQVTKQKRHHGVFAKPQQCFGVDKDKSIIKINKKIHPNANWFDDEWTKVIKGQDNFNPGIVYLDTCYFGDRYPALHALKQTLDICPEETLVICNVMMSNSRAGLGDKLFDESAIIENLLFSQHPEAYASWNISPEDKDVNIFHSYEYQTSCTPMRSYIFFKGVLPKEDLIKKEFDKFRDWCQYTQFTL